MPTSTTPNPSQRDRFGITQPDKVFVTTQYFRKKLVPLLGHALAWLIIALRQHCYWNRAPARSGRVLHGGADLTMPRRNQLTARRRLCCRSATA